MRQFKIGQKVRLPTKAQFLAKMGVAELSESSFDGKFASTLVSGMYKHLGDVVTVIDYNDLYYGENVIKCIIYHHPDGSRYMFDEHLVLPIYSKFRRRRVE